MEPCRTGESRITGGYKLPSQYALSLINRVFAIS
jgi:hypothetical protein